MMISSVEEAESYCRQKPKYPPNIKTVENALIIPITKFVHDTSTGKKWHSGGVFYKDGRVVEEGFHIPASIIHFPSFPDFELPKRHIRGKWLFAGYTRGHFGQFLLEGLNRFWAIARNQDIDGVIFINYARAGNVSEVSQNARKMSEVKFVRDMINLATGGLPFIIADQALEVDELVVPSSLMTWMILEGDTLHRQFCETITSRLDDNIRDSKSDLNFSLGRKIYVSRSKLSSNLAQFVLESKVEENLSNNGYDIFHPQEYSLEEQVKRYRQATHIIMAEGSAGHLLSMVVNITRLSDYSSH